ncbi:MAG: 50S ribosomal protein L29 [Flavobacteriaceae bacterium]
MKAKELRDLSITELEARIDDINNEVSQLNFNKAVAGQVENPAQMRARRRELARLKTIIHEKNTGDQVSQEETQDNE